MYILYPLYTYIHINQDFSGVKFKGTLKFKCTLKTKFLLFIIKLQGYRQYVEGTL
jgi:hypothetical protein